MRSVILVTNKRMYDSTSILFLIQEKFQQHN